MVGFLVGVAIVVMLSAYSRVMERLNEISTKLDVLFKTADQTLDRAVDARHNVRFLPETLDRLESKVNGIEARQERIERKIGRIGYAISPDLSSED